MHRIQTTNYVDASSYVSQKIFIDEKDNGIVFQDLQLDHIHGYRGFDCRDNLFYLADNEKIVYPAAGAGVVHHIRKGTTTTTIDGRRPLRVV